MDADTHHQSGLHLEKRQLDDASDCGVLADSRNGDPYYTKPTEAEPPSNRARSRAYFQAVTDNGFISNHLVAHNLYNAFTGKWDPFCQWHEEMSWNNTRQGLLDRNAMYLIQIVPPLGDNGVVKVTGEFFPTIYFSYQGYADPGQQEAAANIYDSEIKPKRGLNPYNDLRATPRTAGEYEIYYTTTGQHGLPNEQKINITEGVGLIVLRLYKTIPDEPLPLDQAIVPPKIQMGELSNPSSFDKIWPPCTPQLRGSLSFGATWAYQRINELQMLRVPVTGHCPMPLGTKGMRLFDSTKTSAVTRSVVVARNENSPYLFYCLDTRSLRRRQWSENDVVLRLTTKLPIFARGLYDEEPRIAEKEKYDVRFVSFLTTGPQFPFQTYEEIDGQGIERHYNQVLGVPLNDTTTWDRRVTMIIATDPETPKRCGLINEGSDIYIGFRQLHNEGANYPILVQPPHVFNPSFVYRQELGDPNKPTASKAYRGCGGGDACADDDFLQGQLQEYYPAIQAFYCHLDGHYERIPKADEAEVADRFPETVPGITNPTFSSPRNNRPETLGGFGTLSGEEEGADKGLITQRGYDWTELRQILKGRGGVLSDRSPHRVRYYS